jgi:PAS domain S-box-containing protein
MTVASALMPASSPGSCVSPRIVSVLGRAHTLCAVGALAPAVVVLIGWLTGTVELQRFAVGHTTMKFFTAVAACLLAAAFLLPAAGRAAAACACVASAIGGFSLAEYALGAGSRFDQLLVHDAVPSAHPGRMAPNSAVVLLLLGTAAVLLPRRGSAARIGHALAVAALGVCFLAVIGLGSGAQQLYGASATYMALPSVIAFTLLAFAAVLARLDLGIGATLSRTDVEGNVLRFTLGPAIALPLVLGLGHLGLVKMGVSHTAADWLYAVACVTTLIVCAVVAARYLGRAGSVAAEANERLRTIFELSPLAILTIDTEGNVTSWNPAAEELFGYAADEVIGTRPPLVTEQAFAVLQSRFDRFADGETIEADVTCRRKDGTRVTARAALSPVQSPDGAFAGVSALVADVTERRAFEEELRRLNNELENRVGERTTELLAANRELQAFSYSVSHDLRAPLRALNGFSTALEEDYGDRLDETAHDYLARIRGAAGRMSVLIDDVLQMARVTRLELEREPVDVTALAQEVGAEIGAAAPGSRVELHVEDGLTALADAGLVRIVLQNLLENAVKFSATAEAPRVEVRAGNEGEIVVSDNGVGFDPAYAEKLFMPFQRLHAAGEFPGNGIGLATVQNIVNRHGGAVRADSTPGGGASFTFTLGPVNAVSEHERTPQPTDRSRV